MDFWEVTNVPSVDSECAITSFELCVDFFTSVRSISLAQDLPAVVEKRTRSTINDTPCFGILL